MANTLTNLIPDFYTALDVVSRERVGFIQAVSRDSSADSAALNQTLRIPVAPAASATFSISPAMSLPSAADQTIGNVSFTITKVKASAFSWSSEEIKSVNAGPGFLTIQQNEIAQAIRLLVNEMETDIATAAYKGASRAYGTAATTPFGTAGDYSDAAQLRKILDDNGAPSSDRTIVLNTSAGANIRAKQAQAYMAGSNDLQRSGVLFDISGFSFRESAQVQTVTAGAMASATTSAAALTVGQTVLPLATAGTGVVAAGDIITLANDSNKYVVSAVSFAGSNPASGDSITIAAPGLRVAQSSAARAITVVATSARNIGLSRNAILLGTRLPAVIGTDLADDRMTVVDPISGISMELAHYPGFRMGVYHLSCAWGVSVIKPEHCAVLLG
jgi:hypothetical protein